jgi:8-oxo-dGTP diphosphatase
MRQHLAVRAVIVREKKILIIRESQEYIEGNQIGKWDFPGGKVEPGESLNDALLREAREESGLEIEIGKPFFVSEWFPAIKGEQVQIVGIFFLCYAKSDSVILGTDHDKFEWINLEDYSGIDLMIKNKQVLEYLKTACQSGALTI